MKPDALVAVARAVFEAAGGTPIDPDYVLPADIPLELSGEAVRTRLCLFTDHRGAEMVMRPDLTLPVAQREAARREAGETGARTYTYAARAFRQPVAPDDQLEFTQVGLERFGYDVTDKAAAVAAFQRRWRPHKIDGEVDGQIGALLFELLLARDLGHAR
jgi:ATP phosphoribosyltransferase regulatory subunit